jgi:hypothetical protein
MSFLDAKLDVGSIEYHFSRLNGMEIYRISLFKAKRDGNLIGCHFSRINGTKMVQNDISRC